jgi:hypothetical protein
MSEDLLLFDRALRGALDGESLDDLWEKHAAATLRGDGERLRLLTEVLQTAVTLGNHAVVAEQSKRSKQ